MKPDLEKKYLVCNWG